MKELEENIILKNSIDLANENTQISGNLNLEKRSSSYESSSDLENQLSKTKNNNYLLKKDNGGLDVFDKEIVYSFNSICTPPKSKKKKNDLKIFKRIKKELKSELDNNNCLDSSSKLNNPYYNYTSSKNDNLNNSLFVFEDSNDNKGKAVVVCISNLNNDFLDQSFDEHMKTTISNIEKNICQKPESNILLNEITKQSKINVNVHYKWKVLLSIIFILCILLGIALYCIYI